jgi:hypothetical protein
VEVSSWDRNSVEVFFFLLLISPKKIFMKGLKFKEVKSVFEAKKKDYK